MRKYFIDNLRWICILLLFPYHTFRIFSTNDNFYISGSKNIIMTGFVYFLIPWFMSLLFLLAGISTRYALKKRTTSKYIIERITKLLIPFIAGFILLIPLQTYYANKFHNNYTGNIIDQYKVFFITITDLSGYDGGMTPGHLWFLLYLFVISLIALIPIIFFKKKETSIKKWNFLFLLTCCLILIGANYIGNSGGKSIGKFLVLFCLGYYIFSDDNVLSWIKKRFVVLTIIWITLNSLYVFLNLNNGIDNDILNVAAGFMGCLALLGIAQRILDFSNPFTKYCSKSSFPIYIFHQTILVFIGYYVLSFIKYIWIQAFIICLSSLLITLITYEIIKKIPGVRFIFGIKGEKHGSRCKIIEPTKDTSKEACEIDGSKSETNM